MWRKHVDGRGRVAIRHVPSASDASHTLAAAVSKGLGDRVERSHMLHSKSQGDAELAADV